MGENTKQSDGKLADAHPSDTAPMGGSSHDAKPPRAAGIAAQADRPVAERGRSRKSPTAFRTISEVADELHIPQHVLRFWETKFPQVKPMKRGGGRSYYRPDDIALLRRISDLLYIQGYTIKGVQRLLRAGGGRLSDDIPPPPADEHDEDEPELPIPGLAPAGATAQAAMMPRARARGEPDGEAARLRALLSEVLRELEAIRRLLG
jgi:DNA-binding transcriptional MerR regulator